MTLHSPERSWRAAGCAVLALGAVWQFAVRAGTTAGVVLGCVLAAALLVSGWRISRTRLVADTQGLTDYRAFRVVRVSWREVAGFEVARPGGIWDGFCVRAVRHTGQPVDLLATRGYSLLPSGWGYDEVHRMMWTLQELRTPEG